MMHPLGWKAFQQKLLQVADTPPVYDGLAPLSPSPPPLRKNMIDRTINIAENRRWISLADPYEVRDWCASLGCSKSELKDAVAAVGPSAEKVHQYLGQRMPAGAGRARPL